MKNKAILAVLVFTLLVSCNPCKYVTRHPECFPGDSITQTEKHVIYEKIYTTEDSVIIDTIPCDPITETAIEIETVYKTIWKTKIDTIYNSKETVKINPVNAQLKKSVEKINNKLIKKKQLNRIYLGIIVVFLLSIVVFFIVKKV